MKQAEIFTSDLSAGILTENEDGFFFRYHEEYLQNEKAEPISLTLPLQEMPFKSDRFSIF